MFSNFAPIIYPYCIKMRKIFSIIMTAIVLSGMAVSCGGNKSDSTVVNENVEEQNTLLAEALSVGNLKDASAMADSMSLFVDDFTPEQTVQVLMAFLSVHNGAVEKKESRRDLETLRKFVDVYDIATGLNPNDTRAAFEKARRINPAVNFDSLARVFREQLTQYDAVQDGSLVNDEPAPADTAVATPDTVVRKTEADLPLELRPAD